MMDDVHLSNSIESAITQFPPHNLITRFPVKLWRMVNSCTSGSISWSKDGKSVQIHKRLFEAEFLKDPNSPFKTESFNSFIRQLNLYGFQKVIHRDRYFNHVHQNFAYEFQEYRNPNFRRGFPEMIPYVQRRARIRKESQEEYAERFSRLINPPAPDKSVQIQSGILTQTFKPYQPENRYFKTLHNDIDTDINIVQNCGDTESSVKYIQQSDVALHWFKTELPTRHNQSEGMVSGDAIEQAHNENISFLDFLTSDIDTQQLVIKYENDLTDVLADDICLPSTMEPASKEISPANQDVLIGSESTNQDLPLNDSTNRIEGTDASFYIIGQNKDNAMSAYPLQMDDNGQIYVKIPVTLPNTKCIKNVNLDLTSCDIEFQTSL